MHPALLKLMRLQFVGWFRRQLTGGSARRLISGVIGVVMFLVWLSSLVMGAALRQPKAPVVILSQLPLVLSGLGLVPLLLGAGDRAIAFSPAEIDFLFPGPFSRRQIVSYKLLKLSLGSLAGGVIFGLMLRGFAITFVGGLVGAALSLLFINLMTTAVTLVRDTIEERLYTTARRALLFIVLAAGVLVALRFKDSGLPTAEDVRRLTDTPAGRVLLAPARIFAHVFASRSLIEVLSWAAVCLGPIAGAVALVFALDRGYMEAALVASQRRQARIARLRGGVAITPGKRVRSVSLTRLGALGPGGAIANKQVITAFRTSRAWMFVFVGTIAYGYFISRTAAGPGGAAGADRHAAIEGLVPGLLLVLFMLPQMLRFDFRSDLDHLDWLKALPATPMAVAAAELAVPSIILALMGWTIVGGAAVFIPIPTRAIVMAAIAAPVVGLIMVALENFVFLILPTRQLAPGQATTVFSGRRLLMTLARLALLAVGGGAILGIGLGVRAVGASINMTFAACWLALCAVGVGMIGAVAWAFAKFDVSVDMPV